MLKIIHMILFYEDGRLGNQLFQLAALKQYFPKHQLLFLGCKDLRLTLKDVDAIFICKDALPRLLRFLLPRVLLKLSQTRILGSIREVRTGEMFKVESKRGLVPRIYVLNESYFQHKDFIVQLNPSFQIDDGLKEKARQWLDANTHKIPGESHLAFVHVRRGDYLVWPDKTHPAVLSKSWYLRAMSNISRNFDSVFFVLITDDHFYAEDCFGGYQNVLISKNDQYVDLALMSLCAHGVLSPSSFAWWGGYFSYRHNLQKGFYIAPRYWAGHAKSSWYPNGFVTEWLTYID
jgi:hypothetical protein